MTGTVQKRHAADIDRLLKGSHHDPHALLGPHREGADLVVRAFHPDANDATLAHVGGVLAMTRVDDRGLFEVRLADTFELSGYRLRFVAGGHHWEADDPYRFGPTLGALDLHLINEGTHRQLWRRLGARVITHQGVRGTAFAVWAPNALGVRLVSDAGGWDQRLHPMRSLDRSGVWELFVPNVGAGCRYKFLIIRPDGRSVLKADPLARAAELPPATASIVEDSQYTWHDHEWILRRGNSDPVTQPMSIYEVHLGSWRRGDGDRVLSYTELADQLSEYCTRLGFTHVELMPVAEHPFGGSWGYQVTSYYAPTARHGRPDDLRSFIDRLHQRGIGVIIDWVPAHFPRDDWALARFDGTALYEHADPRRGEHADWGTLVFNYGRNEVRNFLSANALYWIEEFHADGLRVDAVASMLYLDYSRRPGEWIPNAQGGRENLEAIDFLRDVNDLIHVTHPGVATIAEESTAWPGVSRPVSAGGLGFTLKWNMGWMHDTLAYLARDPVYRQHHHEQLTFGLWYAWSENFVLPLSHDEVVHLKGSLLGKMPGDDWQRFANVRALFAWMWAHPGKKLLFMGGELAQLGEWAHDRSLDWHLLDDPRHRGVRRLITDLNARYREVPALWERDASSEGFRWIDAANASQNIAVFARYDGRGRAGMVCVANFSPVTHHDWRLGLPFGGDWREVVNTDSALYAGSGQGNLGVVRAESVPWHGMEHSALMTVPPLGVVWLVPPTS